MLELLRLAGKYAHSKAKEKDKRLFLLGAVGIRADGRIVHARNEAVQDTDIHNVYRRFPESHAEHRLTRKLGYGAIVYVARIARGTGEYAMARPCEHCRNILRAFKVEKVFYTIDPNHYGAWFPKKDSDIIYSL